LELQNPGIHLSAQVPSLLEYEPTSFCGHQIPEPLHESSGERSLLAEEVHPIRMVVSKVAVWV
jgi:hypothetical protein